MRKTAKHSVTLSGLCNKIVKLKDCSSYLYYIK